MTHAIAVIIEGKRNAMWFAENLLEFLDHQPGITVFGYDDVARITSDNCGSVWSQTYDYGVNGGEYDNLSKSGSRSWTPGYNSSNKPGYL